MKLLKSPISYPEMLNELQQCFNVIFCSVFWFFLETFLDCISYRLKKVPKVTHIKFYRLQFYRIQLISKTICMFFWLILLLNLMRFWGESLIYLTQDLMTNSLSFGEESWLLQYNVLCVYTIRIKITVNIHWKSIKYSDYICFYGFYQFFGLKTCFLYFK